MIAIIILLAIGNIVFFLLWRMSEHYRHAELEAAQRNGQKALERQRARLVSGHGGTAGDAP